MSMRVAFLGLGTMGSRQAAVLQRRGFDMTVWNRTPAVARSWAAEHGGARSDSAAEAVSRADAVITMVVDGRQVHKLLAGPDGAAKRADRGTVFIDMSTTTPADAQRTGAALARMGMAFVDAPVSGSAAKAADGTLTIMAGGGEADIARVLPLLKAMGEKLIHVGPLGHGQAAKLVHNAVAATNLATIGQALVAGDALGLDLGTLVEVMGAGAAGSVMLEKKAPAMLDHDYTPLFKLDHMLKDLRACLGETDQAGVPFSLASHAADLFVAASANGLGDQDFAAVLDTAERMGGRRI